MQIEKLEEKIMSKYDTYWNANEILEMREKAATLFLSENTLTGININDEGIPQFDLGDLNGLKELARIFGVPFTSNFTAMTETINRRLDIRFQAYYEKVLVEAVDEAEEEPARPRAQKATGGKPGTVTVNITMAGGSGKKSSPRIGRAPKPFGGKLLKSFFKGFSKRMKKL
jgi:hypothetical protein